MINPDHLISAALRAGPLPADVLRAGANIATSRFPTGASPSTWATGETLARRSTLRRTAGVCISILTKATSG